MITYTTRNSVYQVELGKIRRVKSTHPHQGRMGDGGWHYFQRLDDFGENGLRIWWDEDHYVRTSSILIMEEMK